MSRYSVQGRRWRKVCATVRERDGETCQECGATEDLTVDHIIPVSTFTTADLAAGRQYDLDNLRVLCRSCNGRKQDRLRPRATWFNPRFFDETAGSART